MRQDVVIQKRETVAQSILNSKVLLEIIELHEEWDSKYGDIENDLIFANEVSQSLQRHTKRLIKIGFLTPDIEED